MICVPVYDETVERDWLDTDRFFPFVVGMAYFIPLDLSFTFWFFYIFWKFEMIFGSIAGLQRIPGSPSSSTSRSGCVSVSCV